jgi:hypothetical protein
MTSSNTWEADMHYGTPFRTVVIVGVLSIAGINYSFSAEPRCDRESKLQCASLMKASAHELLGSNSMTAFSAAKAYCEAYRVACAKEVYVTHIPTSGAMDVGPQSYPTPEKRLFVRADSLDNPYPGLTQSPSAGQALGASVGYTNNAFVQTLTKSGKTSVVTVGSSQSITSTGMISYLLAPSDFVPGSDYVKWVPSMWLYANGSWDNPRKTFGDVSVLRAGPRLAFESIGTQGFLNYFDVAGFYQTDFYGTQQAGGASASWSPVNYNYFLGGSNKLPANSILDWFWELRAEATNVSVADAGVSNLQNRDYQWLGGAARVYLFPFSTRGGGSWGPYLNDRFSVIGTAQSYWDAISHAEATLYSVAVQYKLACNTLPDLPSVPPTTQVKGSDCAGGAVTLTLQYDNGVDKDLMQRKNLLQLKLNYAY